jgi:molybdopterin synthase sulfur carrier subunit
MKPDDSRLRTVQVLYFARLREAFGRDREDVILPEVVTDVAGLAGWLRQRGEPWSVELGAGKAFRVAVNQDMAEAGTPVRAGDEIAFFPPVTGG